MWSFREYRKDRALESADAIAAEAERRAAEEAELEADRRETGRRRPVPAGRPSAPRD